MRILGVRDAQDGTKTAAINLGALVAIMSLEEALMVLVEGTRRALRRQLGFNQPMITSGVADHGVGRVDLRTSWTEKISRSR